jgi:hypothetical protein
MAVVTNRESCLQKRGSLMAAIFSGNHALKLINWAVFLDKNAEVFL